jgi:SPP1 gp7 family putative phage head morphogenesis protein
MFNTIKKYAQNAFNKFRTLAPTRFVRDAPTSLFVSNVQVRPIERQTQDINKWRNALRQAEGYTQQRYPLYDLYSEILMDGFLNTLIQKRSSAITNTPLTFQIDGKPVEEVIAITQKTYFAELVKEILNARFWGHSLIELQWQASGNNNKPSQTVLIPRKHVKPRFGIVTQNQWEDNGIDYRQPPFNNVLIEVGEPEDLGVLLQACPHVIYKRGNFGDWAEFAEVFGMPFRWATYNNEQSRQILEEALEKAGSAGYVVAPADAQLQFLNHNAQSGTNIFSQLNAACNEELSITILGNTMTTTEAKSSGYAQSKTHQSEQNALHQDDRMFVLRVLNEQLTPFLKKLGYNVEGGSWGFVESDGMTLAERLEMDLKIHTVAPIDLNYFYEKYNVPKGIVAKDTKENVLEKKKLSDQATYIDIELFYKNNCNHFNLNGVQNVDRFINIPDNINEEYLKSIYGGKLRNGNVDEKMWRKYFNSFRNATGITVSYSPDWEFNQLLTSHVASFSAFKNHAATGDLLKQLIGDDGRIKSFAQFKRDAAPYINAYNHNWLQAEYQTAVASSRMALKWQQIQRRKDTYPNLEYVTQRDDRVRDEHRPLDKIIRAVDDPFWKIYYPPNGWRCRCDVKQTTDKPNDLEPDGFVPDAAFNQNVGETALLWGQNHPYFSEAQLNTHWIEDRAKAYYAKLTRQEVRDWSKTHLIGKTKWELPQLPMPATITGNEVKHITGTPHKNAPTRNQLLYVLNDILKELVFVGTAKNVAGKNHDAVILWYYYKYTINGEEYFFNFQHIKIDAHTERVGLYAITDRIIGKIQ